MKINSINNQYNYNFNKKNKNYEPSASFKGIVPNSVSNKLSNFYENTVVKNSAFKKFVHWFSHSDNTFTHLIAAESAWLSSFYMFCTLKNDKIEKDQKPQMLINETLTLAASTAGAYLVEDKISNWVGKKADKYIENHKDFYFDLAKKSIQKDKKSELDKLIENTIDVFNCKQKGNDIKEKLNNTSKLIDEHFEKLIGKQGKLKTFQMTKEELNKNKNSVSEIIKSSKTSDEVKQKIQSNFGKLYERAKARNLADNTISGINKLKVLVIFGTVYRFVSPVLFTPVANKLSSKFFPSKKDKAENFISLSDQTKKDKTHSINRAT